jgi:polar amino acid transport system substrate-binding protein
LPNGTQYKSDNLAVILKFSDGSIANLLYLANGDRSVPKEFFEVFCQGAIARLDDFRTLELARNGKLQKHKSMQDKGYRQELQLTIEAMRSGKPSPISFGELAEVTEATFLVQQAITTGDVLRLTQPTLASSTEAPMLEFLGVTQDQFASTGDTACA